MKQGTKALWHPQTVFVYRHNGMSAEEFIQELYGGIKNQQNLLQKSTGNPINGFHTFKQRRHT